MYRKFALDIKYFSNHIVFEFEIETNSKRNQTLYLERVTAGLRHWNATQKVDGEPSRRLVEQLSREPTGAAIPCARAETLTRGVRLSVCAAPRSCPLNRANTGCVGKRRATRTLFSRTVSNVADLI